MTEEQKDPLQHYKERMAYVDALRELVMSEFAKGIDYDSIPLGRRATKPTLLKPGAEKIALMLNASVRYEVLEETFDADFCRSVFKVQLVADGNGVYPEGQVLGEGIGEANSGERNWQNQNVNFVVNNVLKIAKKRALVDAALTAAGLSTVFTQDIEDMSKQAAPNETPVIAVRTENTASVIAAVAEQYETALADGTCFTEPDKPRDHVPLQEQEKHMRWFITNVIALNEPPDADVMPVMRSLLRTERWTKCEDLADKVQYAVELHREGVDAMLQKG
jgi:hypothetical protein